MLIYPFAYFAGTTASTGNDSFTKVLLHMDGTNTSTTFTDSCAGATPHTFTANGNAQLTTGTKKFGTAAGTFDGTGDYVDTPDSADFTLGSGDFTVDAWFNRAAGDGTFRALWAQCDSGAINISGFLRLMDTNVMQFGLAVGSTTTNKTIAGTTTFTSTGWHHVAAVRTSGTMKLFLDGVQEGGDLAASGTVNDSAFKFTVGRLGEFSGQDWNGQIDEFRLSVGVARWTSNFTPPTVAYSP